VGVCVCEEAVRLKMERNPSLRGRRKLKLKKGEKTPLDQAGLGGDGEYLQSATIN